jgi:tRNA threonylcarbamoyladenosine biosynthesis protein TsaE
LLRSFSAEDSTRIGTLLGKLAFGGLILCLDGGLAAGKTVVARGVARGLGIQDNIVSPSYALVLEYPGNPTLVHMDWYRMNGPDEVENLGIQDFFDDTTIVLIEWFSRAPQLIPESHLRIHIKTNEDSSREITLAIPEYCPVSFAQKLSIMLENLYSAWSIL